MTRFLGSTRIRCILMYSDFRENSYFVTVFWCILNYFEEYVFHVYFDCILVYSLIIQEYGQNTEGHICPNSTLSKYGRIQRIFGTFQNTAKYNTEYNRIQVIRNCTKSDKKLYPFRGAPAHVGTRDGRLARTGQFLKN